MEDDYTCSLDEKSIKKAKDELNEIPSDRLAAVQALREWVNDQKHLRIDTNTGNLLRFLRHAKFSQAKARETIENVLKFFGKNLQFIADIDTHDKKLQEVLKLGQIVVLPGYDDEGRRIILYRLTAITPSEIKKKWSPELLIRSWNATFLSMMSDEICQVNGILIFADMTGLSLKLIAGLSDPVMMKYHKEAQNAQVGRMKGFHYYNVGGLFEAFFALYKPYMKQKHRERIRVHETLESVYEVIPKRMLPLEYLPDDYSGPNAGTIEKIIDDQLKVLVSERDQILQKTNRRTLFYDETLKPKTEEPLQHFRKLNVD
ncbi:DgyrCDS1857 [Dimorphilus gyrociliatus]|uniref:DgyrCDS1857 n=1 Tax=Dimorphilus gyrociliatus TaxID=2664684 RepID=A0A7I8V8L7_9ANNE|nr:DgyrCDS1857 [Dimorphilus gyrociliatus]